MGEDKLSNLEQIRILRVGTESRIKELVGLKKRALDEDKSYLNLIIENLNNVVKWMKKIEDRGILK